LNHHVKQFGGMNGKFQAVLHQQQMASG
jgi:hypothetical protein